MALHKKFDFTQLGGFPFSQETLALMQDATTGLSDAIVGLVGDNKIVAGCRKVVGQGSVLKLTAGWATYNNELLPVMTGNALPFFRLVEEKVSLPFADGIQKEVQFSRYLVPDGSGSIILEERAFVVSGSPLNYTGTNFNESGGVLSAYDLDIFRIADAAVLITGYLITQLAWLDGGTTYTVNSLPYTFAGETKRIIVGSTIYSIISFEGTNQFELKREQSLGVSVGDYCIPFSTFLKIQSI